MLIKILGPGCRNCAALERATREALTRLDLHAQVEHVTDYAAIAGYGVMHTPALVLDEKVLLAGKVSTATQIAELLATHARHDSVVPRGHAAEPPLSPA